MKSLLPNTVYAISSTCDCRVCQLPSQHKVCGTPGEAQAEAIQQNLKELMEDTGSTFLWTDEQGEYGNHSTLEDLRSGACQGRKGDCANTAIYAITSKGVRQELCGVCAGYYALHVRYGSPLP